MNDFKFPPQTIDLPSRGHFYPPDHPLACGKIDIHPVTARMEDILTSKNFIMKGIAVDKFLEALIASPDVKYKDLLMGDKNGLMVAARILGYGKIFEGEQDCRQCKTSSPVEIDLQNLNNKDVPFEENQRGKNEFIFTLPVSNIEITFKLLTQGDDETIRQELDSLRKATKSDVSPEVTTRMRHAILSVNGERNRETIRKFVDDALLSRDVEAFRRHARKVNPDIELSYDFECPKCGYEGREEVPIDITFFWPYARI